MIIDAHCHLIPSQEGVGIALGYMADAGVDHTVLVPGGMVPLLGMADFLRGRQALNTRAPDNEFVMSVFARNPRQFSGFFHVDPSYHLPEDWDEAIAGGFNGFKLSPLVNRVSYLSAEVRELCDYLVDRDMPLYTHIVMAGDASLDALSFLLQDFPRLKLILGHMGFAGTDSSAIQLAMRFENVYLETSVGSFIAIREAVRRLGARRVIFGSEGPVHHVGAELRKIELLRLSAADHERVCGLNICDLARLHTKLKILAPLPAE
jgi:predicted TIM-barrel fold metal-dependent hydrolase